MRDLSQKGGLPFPSETACSERRSKAADARKFLRERPRHRPKPGPPASPKPGGLSGTHPNKSQWCPAFL